MLDMIIPEKDGIDLLNEILLTGIPVKIVLTSDFSDSPATPIFAWQKVSRSSTIMRTSRFCASRSAANR
jgi:hypothetical protein